MTERNKSRIYLILLALVLGLALIATYSNSFENDFQFDDSHSVVKNPYIRSLSNIPQFFVDGKTFSVLPSNQSYRPLVTASLAIDYWLGDGLEPFYFHLSTFLWFLVQLSLMYLFFVRVTDSSIKDSSNKVLALIMVAWYGLHPALADTVNYVIQRGELYSTLSVVLAFVLYQYLPNIRRTGLYLLPIAIGTLAKPPAIMFAPILFFYILFFEQDSGLYFWQRSYSWRKFWNACLASIPAFVCAAVLYVFQSVMTPTSFTPGGVSVTRYLITQPFVHLSYVRNLFLPDQLSVDSDLSLFTDITDPRALLGFAFYLVVILLVIRCSKSLILRPISFGLLWFVISNIPTTVVPLAEVTNNHRMFFPFIGLILSVCWSIRLVLTSSILSSSKHGKIISGACIAILVALLPLYSYGTIIRNEVWRTDETLWYDTAQKSPGNGRALMNYGLTQMAKGEYPVARDYFYRAEPSLPFYPLLQINIGIVEGAIGNNVEAEKRFKRAISLGSKLGSPYFYYARWLKRQGRLAESIKNINLSLTFAPEDFIARYLRLDIALEQRDWSTIKSMTAEMLQKTPDDPQTLEYRMKGEEGERNDIPNLEQAASSNPTADNLIMLSLGYFRHGRMLECIEAADKAIALNPRSAEAFNNKSAAYSALSRWSESIAAAEKAIEIKPDFQLAKNNLAWAKSELAKANQ